MLISATHSAITTPDWATATAQTAAASTTTSRRRTPGRACGSTTDKSLQPRGDLDQIRQTDIGRMINGRAKWSHRPEASGQDVDVR